MAQYTDQELARLIRDGKISPTDANKAMSGLAGNTSMGNTAATGGTKVLWEQNPTTGNYHEMDVGTGNYVSGAYDQPFGSPVTQPVTPVTDPYADAMKEYQAQINALATETDPDYDENLEQASPEEMAEEIL